MKKEQNPTSDYEISVIRRLVKDKISTQDIQAKIAIYRYFVNNNKGLNYGRISDIDGPQGPNSKTALGKKSLKIPPADDETINNFFNIIKCGDLQTKLNPFIKEHELIIKARESMISAISSFNNPIIRFNIEQFLVLSHIAWTALLQSIAVNKNINIKDNKNKSQKLKYLAIRDLIKTLSDIHILTPNVCNNLDLLIQIRDQITHSPEGFIPKEIFTYLQANCFNFNNIVIKHYGPHRGLDNIFSVALQMATFKPVQLKQLVEKDSVNKLPYITNIINEFEAKLEDNELQDQEYKCTIAIIPMSVNKINKADVVYIADPNSKDAKDIANIIFKSQIKSDKQNDYPYLQQDLIKILQNEGFNINKPKIEKIIKEHNIKTNPHYAYEHNVYTNKKPYKYSEGCVQYLRKILQKKS